MSSIPTSNQDPEPPGRTSLHAGALTAILIFLLGGCGPADYGGTTATPDTAEELITSAEQRAAQGDPERAAELYRRALSMLPEEDRRGAARIQLQLALLSAERGDYVGARAGAENAAAVLEETGGADDPELAAALSELGNILYRLGAYPQSESALRRALEVQERTGGSAEVAATLNRLGALYRDLGEYPKAENVFQQALAVLAQHDPPDEALGAAVRSNLGGLEYYRGEFSAAVRWYEEALEMQTALHGPEHADVGKTLNNLGLMYQELGDYQRADSMYRRALAIKETHFGTDHPTVGSTVHNLAMVSELTGEVEQAEALYRRALEIYENSVGPEHPNVAIVANALGWLYHQQGDEGRAEALLLRALEIKEQTLGDHHGWVAETLINLAPVYSGAGDYTQADAMFRRALSIAAAAGEPELLWDVYAGYSQLFADRGNLRASVFFGKQAVNTIQRMRAGLDPLAKPLQQSFLEVRQQVYKALADRLIDLGRLAEAQQVLDMLKEEEFFDFVRAAREPGDAVSDPVGLTSLEAPWAAEFDAYSQRLAAIEAELEALAEREPDGLTGTEQARQTTLNSEAQRERESFVARLAGLEAAFREAAAGEALAFDGHNLLEIQQTLRDLGHAAALIHYLITDEKLRILLTTPEGQFHRDSEVSATRLNRLVFSFRQTLSDPARNPLPEARQLYGAIMAPIEPELRQAKVETLMVSLDGALRYVPVAALHDQEAYLVERFRLAMYTPAVRLQLQHQPGPEWSAAGLGVSRDTGRFSALPMVPAELDGIVLQGGDDRDGVMPGVIYLDEEFTRQRLAQTLDRGYPLVHIASHFVFRPGTLHDSFLVLGGGATLDLAELRESAFPFTSVELLTLSACDTAIGVDGAQGREFESFGALAQKQGARSVLATLWPVADRSTGRFMRELYRIREQGLTKAEALRRAQLAFIAGSRSGTAGPEPSEAESFHAPATESVDGAFDRDPRAPYAHPFYWAPFVLMGNWL